MAMAEGAGFEPARRFITVYTLSRRAPSTARPPLQGARRLADRREGCNSQHTERSLASGRWKGVVERSQILFRQLDVEGAAVLAHMLRSRGLRNHTRALLAQQTGEPNLRRRRAAAARNLGERLVAEHARAAQWRISHDRDLVFAAPGEEVPLGAAVGEIVQHLIGCDSVAAAQSRPFRHIGAVKIA